MADEDNTIVLPPDPFHTYQQQAYVNNVLYNYACLTLIRTHSVNDNAAKVIFQTKAILVAVLARRESSDGYLQHEQD